MYCKQCGKEIDDDSKHCKFCGNYISEQKDEVGILEPSKLVNKNINNKVINCPICNNGLNVRKVSGVYSKLVSKSSFSWGRSIVTNNHIGYNFYLI